MLEQYNRIFLSGVHFVQSFVTEETFQGLLHQCCILVKRSLQAVGVRSLALRAREAIAQQGARRATVTVKIKCQ
jgi:hypothetical protein